MFDRVKIRICRDSFSSKCLKKMPLWNEVNLIEGFTKRGKYVLIKYFSWDFYLMIGVVSFAKYYVTLHTYIQMRVFFEWMWRESRLLFSELLVLFNGILNITELKTMILKYFIKAIKKRDNKGIMKNTKTSYFGIKITIICNKSSFF